MDPARLIGSLVGVSAPSVAPDGRHVVVVVRRVDLTGNRYRNQLWLVTTDGVTAPRPLSDGRFGAASPVWSPDGSHLAFVSDRGEHGAATLHLLPMAGPGETGTLCTMNEAITAVTWSPDGRWLAFCARRRDARYDVTDPAMQPPRRISRFLGRLDGEGWVYDRPSHVWVVPADGLDDPCDLTEGEYSFTAPSWLRDSSGLIVAGAAHDTWDLDFAVDLHRVSLGGGRTALTDRTGIYGSPAVSPDGGRIAFLGSDEPGLSPQNTRVGVLDLGTGARRWVSEGLDRTFAPSVHTQPPIWTADGIFATAEDRGATRLYLVDPTGERIPAPISPDRSAVVAFSEGGTTIALALATDTRPAELFVTARPDPAPGEAAPPMRRTQVTDRLVERTSPRPLEHFVAPSSGGVDVDVWVVTPEGYDGTGSWPVLLDVHGGPFTQYGWNYFDEAQLQAANGYVVVLSNPRGSSGRDQGWGQATVGPTHPIRPGSGWGSVDIDDVIAALDEALRRFPGADRQRVGMLGGSYGGYVATWLAAHHGDRFRAICSERAVNNLVSEEWNSDIATTFRVDHGATHLADEDEYRRMSPSTYVDRIHVPMLIVHSEDDLRCPITQAEELFVALRLLGRDVTFLRFPGEGHELSRSGSPGHRVQRAEAILEFFDRHLKPAAAPTPG